MTPVTPITRLAPTPSGALHLGNAFSFLAAWTFARAAGGKVILRLEDVDLARARPIWIEGVFRDLEWLGLDWDEGPEGPGDANSAFRQSSPVRQARYAALLEAWTARDLLYPCRCTRRERIQDAPQVEHLGQNTPGEAGYSGRCRERKPSDAGPHDAWRLRLPPRLGAVHEAWGTPPGTAAPGDPVLRRGDGIFAYHLAVCADDADQGVTHVVRGRDLSGCAPLHAHLHGLIGAVPPTFLHHGLLGESDGARLAKRAGSGSLATIREAGVDARVVVGSLAPLLFPGRIPHGGRLAARDLPALGAPAPLPDAVRPELPPSPTETP